MTPGSRPAVVLLTFLLGVTVVGAHDASVPVRREWTTRGAVSFICAYRNHVSPRLRGRVTCRYVPTCSAYGLVSVHRHGALRGGWRAVKRIARCNPWSKHPRLDPPV